MLTALALAAALATGPSVVPVQVVAGRPPTPVLGGDQRHMLYELTLTNYSARPVTLDGLRVSSPDGKVLGTYEGDALAGLIAHPGVKASDGQARVLAPGGFMVLYLDTRVPAAERPPRQLVHRFAFAADRPGLAESRTVINDIRVTVDARGPVILGPPLKGPGWLAANALSNDADHRRTLTVVDGKARLAQRYAIDFVKLDAQGRAFTGDPSVNKNWAGYGSQVLAVADGVIVEARDGIPDNTPGEGPAVPINLDTIGGDHVVLKTAAGAHVFYGHLMPGSLKVKAGDRVRLGQILGLLGDSGQSDAPHLHIHVSDGVTALGAEGIAHAFDRFDVAGYVPSLSILETPEGWTGRPGSKVPFQAALPIDNAVVDFAP